MKRLLYAALAVILWDATALARSGGPTTVTAITPPSAMGERHVCRPEDYYPKEQLRQRVTGTAQVDFHIAVDGSAKDVILSQSSGNAALDQAAEDCVATWRYKPAMRNGLPVEIPWNATVVWSLPQ